MNEDFADTKVLRKVTWVFVDSPKAKIVKGKSRALDDTCQVNWQVSSFLLHTFYLVRDILITNFLLH